MRWTYLRKALRPEHTLLYAFNAQIEYLWRTCQAADSARRHPHSFTSMYSRAQIWYSSGRVYFFASSDAVRSEASTPRCSRRQS